LAGKAFPEGRDVVRTYCVSPKRDKIYAVAAVDYEPLAIWEYDIAGQTLRNVVPEKNHLNLARFIEPVEASITNQDGKKIDYYHLPPAGMDPRKKYPVVVDQFTDVGYQPTSQFLANAGIFFVAVCKYGQGRGEFPPEPEDTLAVYNEIIKNPNVDPRRIYLIGESAGTAPIANLLTDHPELWRGAIISAAVAFPQFRPDVKQYHTSILFSFGEEDSAANQQRAEKFSQEACAHLMQTRIVYWPGGHVLFDIGTIKKKYKAIASFILTDY
jgi:dipeptidyl aminopeptidase/acylaminoacyl peptidase